MPTTFTSARPLSYTWLCFHCIFLVPYMSAEGCEVGQWSEWGACTRRNKTCGYKWGLETRTRHIVKKPPKDTIPCPTIAESRMCKMAMRHCRRGKDGLWSHINCWVLCPSVVTQYLEKASHIPHRSTDRVPPVSCSPPNLHQSALFFSSIYVVFCGVSMHDTSIFLNCDLGQTSSTSEVHFPPTLPTSLPLLRGIPQR